MNDLRLAVVTQSRSPHGERGLKCHLTTDKHPGNQSLPTRGAWIEISVLNVVPESYGESLPTRGAWIEIQSAPTLAALQGSRSPHGERGLKCICRPLCFKKASRSPHGERGLKSSSNLTRLLLSRSLPTRGAWIEIIGRMPVLADYNVAPHTGSVD